MPVRLLLVQQPFYAKLGETPVMPCKVLLAVASDGTETVRVVGRGPDGSRVWNSVSLHITHIGFLFERGTELVATRAVLKLPSAAKPLYQLAMFMTNNCVNQDTYPQMLAPIVNYTQPLFPVRSSSDDMPIILIPTIF
jgi:hypothetical protein